MQILQGKAMSFCISMPHGIHVWHIDLATFIISNVGKYTVHGSYGAAEVPFLGGHYPSWNSRTSAYELRARLLVGETAITKCGWSPIGYEGSLSRFKVQGSFLLLCSSTNLSATHIYMYSYIRVKQRPRLSLGIVCWIIHVSRLIRHTKVFKKFPM